MESKDTQRPAVIPENQPKQKKLSRSDITKLGLRSSLLQSSFSYERMQAGGWTWAQVPLWKKIHGNDQEQLAQTMEDNMEFINTSPPLVSILMGLLMSMEEERVDRQTIRGLKNALFGPMAGIGDAIYWFTVMPITGGIAASFASDGNILGPILFLLVFTAIFLMRIPFAHLGYNLGTKAIDVIQENSDIISRVAVIMGLTVIGALISTYIHLNLNINIGDISVQEDFLNAIFPNILPLAFTFLLYWFLKRGVSPIALIFGTLLLAILGSFLGIM